MVDYKIEPYEGMLSMELHDFGISFDKKTFYIDRKRLIWHPDVVSHYNAKYEYIKNHHDINDPQLVAKLLHCRVRRDYLANMDPEKHIADLYAEELYRSRIYELFEDRSNKTYHNLITDIDRTLSNYHLNSIMDWQKKIMVEIADDMKKQATTPDIDICCAKYYLQYVDIKPYPDFLPQLVDDDSFEANYRDLGGFEWKWDLERVATGVYSYLKTKVDWAVDDNIYFYYHDIMYMTDRLAGRLGFLENEWSYVANEADEIFTRLSNDKG
jgi:hypothetical protein